MQRLLMTIIVTMCIEVIVATNRETITNWSALVNCLANIWWIAIGIDFPTTTVVIIRDLVDMFSCSNKRVSSTTRWFN